MPVGTWGLEYGCTTLVDPNRTSQYVANAQDPTYCVDGVNSLAPFSPAWSHLRVDCNCEALRYTAESPGALPTLIPPYTSPLTDVAPWYSLATPESAHFYGFVMEKAEDLTTTPIKREVRNRINPLGGATLGQLRKAARTIKFTVLAFGAYDSALDYGYRWLGEQLTTQCSECETCDMTVRTSCPPLGDEPSYEEWDTGRWTLKEVGLIEGPRYEEPPVVGSECNVRRISFTMVVGVPHGFKCPINQLDEYSWISDLYGKVPAMDEAYVWLDSQVNDLQANGNSANGSTLLTDEILGGTNPAAADSADPLFLKHSGENYLYLPGTAGNSLTVPDSAQLDITSNTIEMSGRFAGNLTPAATAYLALKGSSYATRSYGVGIDSTGHLVFHGRDTASSARDVASTVVVPYATDTPFWWRVTASMSGPVSFYTAPDGSAEPTTWTLLGTAVTTGSWTGGGPLTNNDPLTISAQGKHYNFTLRNGGIIKAQIDFPTLITDNGQVTLVETSANTATCTINRSASGYRSVSVARSTYLTDGADFMEMVSTANLNFSAADPFTVLAFIRPWTNAASMLVGKMATFASGNLGYGLGLDGSGNFVGRISDGTLSTAATGPAGTLGSSVVAAFTRNVVSDTITCYTNGVPGTPVTDTTTGTLSNGTNLRIAKDSTTGFTGELYAVAVWRRALSPAEIISITDMFQSGLYSYCPPLGWICEDDPKVCTLITNDQQMGDEALIVEVQASQILEDLLITITPDTFGYICDPDTAPADFTPEEPCDRIRIPVLPAGYTLRYDTGIQKITVTLPGGEVRDGTPYIDTDSGSPPSFPVVKCGTFCVCVSSARCSWLGDNSTVSVWTMHRELTI